jgi:CubicO group peptidase (beta-lactamase class C family)
MPRILLSVSLALAVLSTSAQSLYFPPPVAGSAWETTDPADLGWCADRIDSLYDYLGAHNTKAFLVLKDGRIVLEHYFGTFTQDSLWYWASAGKTLTSTVVGIAQHEGFVDINVPTSTYLGPGWTSETTAQESQITVRNQLTMTTGLDDGVADVDCTQPSCLEYLADAGTRWAYHNAAYSLLQDVVAQGTGQPFSTYFINKLRNPIGMDGLWLLVGENHLYFSTARSMARFGLLAMNGMVWGNDTILQDTAYFHAATTPSQTLNRSYGYLWWLNGQPSFMLPQTQLVFPGPLVPNAPADMYSALGKNDQIINVVPSQGLVLVRMGNAAEESAQVSIVFDNIIWQYMNALDCNTDVSELPGRSGMSLWPNPATSSVRFVLPAGQRAERAILQDSQGRTVASTTGSAPLDLSHVGPGVYFVKVYSGAACFVSRLVKQ